MSKQWNRVRGGIKCHAVVNSQLTKAKENLFSMF